MKYPVYIPSLSGNEKKYVNECLDTSWISSKGHFVNEFETEFSKYIGVKHSTSVCNGTVAIHLAAASLGLGPGDEVICPSFTYIASANPFKQLGCNIIFCDSQKDSWQMDPEDIEKRITPKTKAIIAVHLYGHPCNMNKICALAQKYNLFLIEDCAEAIGSCYQGKHVGTFGDIACFSFFGNKTITCGEGGMVVCNNDELYERAKHLKGQGVVSWKEYWHDISAFNYRMTNIQAAIGLAQLEQIDIFLSKKHNIADLYREELKNLPIAFHNPIGNVYHSYWMFSILVESSNIRNSLRNWMKEKGIETRPTFPCIHMMPIYNKKFLYLPVAEDISARGINLPSYPSLKEEDVKEICKVIREYYER